MKLTIVLAASLMSLPSSVFADDAKVAAKQHIAAARSLHAQHRLPEALAELEAAYALDPQPRLLFALGQIHVQLGRCERAAMFYRRFLAARPKRADAEVANEAIAGCKTVAVAPPPQPIAAVVVPPIPVARPAVATPQAVRARTRSRRTGRYVGGSLVAGGVISSLGALLVHRGALGARDAAGRATTYEAYELLSDRANARSTTAAILGITGAAAIITGAIVFARHRRDTVELVPAKGLAIAPTPDGAAVSWSGSF